MVAQSEVIRTCQKYCFEPIVKEWGAVGWLFFIAMLSGVIGGIGMQLEHRWSSWHWGDMFREKPVVASPDFFCDTSIVTFFLGILYLSVVCIKRSYCQEASEIDGLVSSTSSLVDTPRAAEEGFSSS